MKTLDSKITAVTVYMDRAQITRKGRIKLERGEQHLCFDHLPEAIEQKSIRVAGNGRAVLCDINFRTVNFAKPQNETIKALKNQQNKLYEKLKEQETLSRLAALERSFLEQITGKITAPEKNRKSGELDPENWIKMIKFYRIKLEELEKQKSSAEKTSRHLEDELQKLNSDLSLLNGEDDKTRNQVDVTVEMQEDGELELELSYMVYGPCWYPVYDLRVSTDDKKMSITYNAMVSQATAEDWEDVQLKLSTAQVQVNGTVPQLNPWHLNIGYPEPVSRSMPSRAAGSSMSKKIAKDDEIYSEESEVIESVFDIEPQTAQVETQAASVVFIPSGTNSVFSDNTPYRVTVLIQDFPADFRYNSVPKLSPYTYLNAKIKNDSDYPMLAGDCNVFLDNNFVANTSLDTVAPEQDFWTSLGVDESIKVERKLLRRFEKEEGLISKKTKFIYEYKFIIENKRKTKEKLFLQDQIPVSGHQNINIELISPKYEKDTETLKLNEEKILEWTLSLKAGEKKEIPLSFSVEYPRGESVQGLF